MPQNTNLNTSPYFDDFDAAKNFYRVLFRPGYSIQARELTTIQSILQNQIESIGKHFFKQGQMVIPGEVLLNTDVDYVKLSSVSQVAQTVNNEIIYKKYDISNLIGRVLVGQTSGILATVISTKDETDTESDTLYVKYITSGSQSTENIFREGETLKIQNATIDDDPSFIVGKEGVKPTTIAISNPDTQTTTSEKSLPLGKASAISIQEGIYFINGFFVRNESELKIIDPYYNKPSKKIGFLITEEKIFPEDDSSLYDNSKGYSNFSAPGSHRFSIGLSLSVYDYNETLPSNFIHLLTIKNGEIQREIVTRAYSLIEETIARRTYDESGDYVVNNFTIDLREYFDQDGELGNEYFGFYSKDPSTGLVGPDQLTPEEASGKMIASVGSGKAYIKGYEVVNDSTKYITIDKARDFQKKENIRVKSKEITNINVFNAYGSPPVSFAGSDLSADKKVKLFSVFNDGTIGSNGDDLVSSSGVITTISSPSGTGVSAGSGVTYTAVAGSPTSSVSAGSGASFTVKRLRAGSVTGIGTATATAIISQANQTYTNILGAVSPSGGSGVTFTITRNSSGAIGQISIVDGGQGYSNGNTITIAGSAIGGTGSADNLTFSVTSVSANTGNIESITVYNGGSGFVSGETVKILGTAVGGTTPANDITFTVTGISSISKKDTLTRRRLSGTEVPIFEDNKCIKTLYVYSASGFSPINLKGSITSSNGLLHFQYTSGSTITNASVEILSMSSGINRTDANKTTVGQLSVTEYTVYGYKWHVDFLKEGVEVFKINNSGTLSVSLGKVFDYNQYRTPLMGFAIPKDFKFVKTSTNYSSATQSYKLSSDSNKSTTFKLHYSDPLLYTRIITEFNHNFTSGAVILGGSSGATGVVEGGLSIGSTDPTTATLSYGQELFLSSVKGEFIEGETITQIEGGDVRTAIIATSGQISHFVVMETGAGYPTAGTKAKLNGRVWPNSIINVSMQGITDPGISSMTIGAGTEVALGRELLRERYDIPPEVTFDLPQGASAPTTDAKVRVVLFQETIKVYTPEDIKSFGLIHSPSNYKFTADINIVENDLNAFTSLNNGIPYSAPAGATYLECDSTGVLTRTEVKVGDLIQVSADNGVTRKYIVSGTTNPTSTQRARILLDSIVLENITSKTVTKIKARVNGAETSTLVFPLGDKEIKSVVENDVNSQISYFFRKDFVETIQSSSNQSVLFKAQLPFGVQRFSAFTKDSYLLTVLNKGNLTNFENGDIIELFENQVTINTTTNNQGLSSGSIDIVFPQTFFQGSLNSVKLKLTATVEYTDAKPKLKKFVQNKRIRVLSDFANNVIPLRGTDHDVPGAIVSYPDAYKIRYIYEGTGGSSVAQIDAEGNLISSNGKDVTDNYIFDNGQRDTIYDVARIILKPGYPAPKSPLIIGFDYFEHSDGDFFVVDSYVHEDGISHDLVPDFESSINGKISLRDCIDFRVKVSNDSTIPSFSNATALNSAVYDLNTSQGAIVSHLIASDTGLPYSFGCNYSHYVDRIDCVYLDRTGRFIVKKGSPSTNPQRPDDVQDGLPLYYLYISAFTKNAKSVKVLPIENKRYTMKDIANLEKRIERLEQYTLLSVLEQDALNVQIKDSVTNSERFKTGFVVDTFTSYQTSDVQSLDYKCSLDLTRGNCRAENSEYYVNLEETALTDADRASNNYVKTGNLITLPYSNVVAIQNNFASNFININEFLLAQYDGHISLYPFLDEWFDDTTRPFVTNDLSLTVTPIVSELNTMNALDKIFDVFTNYWIGVDKKEILSNNSSLTQTTSLSTVSLASSSSTSSLGNINGFVPSGSSVSTSTDKQISSLLTFYIRSKAIKFVVRGLKPNTKVYAFFDGRDVSKWINPDSTFNGIPASSLTGYGAPIITDENGNLSGIFLIPNGHPPISGTSHNEDISLIAYDTSASKEVFSVGEKIFKLSSSPTDPEDENLAATYALTKFIALPFSQENKQIISPSSIFTYNESGTKRTDTIISKQYNKDRTIDPIAQTFKIENFTTGIFATSLDLFFQSKDVNLPVRVKLVTTENGKPTKNVIPYSETTLDTDTFLRIRTNKSISLVLNEQVQGNKTSASGPIKKILSSTGVEVAASTSGTVSIDPNQVYTMVLSNHNGKSFEPGENLLIPSVTTYNVTNNDTVTVSIVRDSGYVKKIVMTDFGTSYSSPTTVSLNSPALPGGVTATATPIVSDGKVFEIEIGSAGSEYMDPPSVLISGGPGSGAKADAIIEYNKKAVRMGVATSSDATIPTKFIFESPVYLENDKEYAFLIETSSKNYNIWLSTLGSTIVNSSSSITTQPLVGSLFRSQNSDVWTESSSEDITFKLNRASFSVATTANVVFKNETFGYEKLSQNPIETYGTDILSSTTSSTLFGGNPTYVKISHKNHGFIPGAKVVLKNVPASGINGLTFNTLNNVILEVKEVGLDYYICSVGSTATTTGFSGGSTIKSSYNRKFERLYLQQNLLTFDQTTATYSLVTTDAKPVDNDSITYNYRQNLDQTGNPESVEIIPNQITYFTTQKAILSPLNQIFYKNDLPVDDSLRYSMSFSTTTENLSPVYDVETTSAIISTNRIDKPIGDSDRFGRRDQQVTFYRTVLIPITDGTLPSGVTVNDGLISISTDTTPAFVVGKNSNTVAKIVAFTSSTIYARVTEGDIFIKGEGLEFVGNNLDWNPTSGSSTGTKTVTVGAQTVVYNTPLVVSAENTEYQINFPINTTIQHKQFNASNSPIKAKGKVTKWDSSNKTITLLQEAASNPNARSTSDIFRVGDVITYTPSSGPTVDLEIKSTVFENGVLFVPEDKNNSSSACKYVTKEIALANRSTGINVTINALLNTVDDIKVYYKYQYSSDKVFAEIDWIPFNGDGSSDNNVIVTPSTILSPLTENPNSYKELKYSVQNLSEFSSFAIKVVMTSENPVFIPKLKDIKCIATI